ncbi:hypothetical protein BDZ89DRAFT_606281 [Hymenopellis radicata]|nr:hypothetical protein BDZ89DRAFT_606281 [Hymenopellis radicata]
MSVTAVLVSPGKPHRMLQLTSPTVRALDSPDLKDLDADSSWGEIASVKLEEQDDGKINCTRERPAIRHANLKASGRELRRETEILQAKVAELERQRSEDLAKLERQRFEDLAERDRQRSEDRIANIDQFLHIKRTSFRRQNWSSSTRQYRSAYEPLTT